VHVDVADDACLSTITMARSQMPLSSFQTPYFFETSPLGWKSARSGYFVIPPMDFANAT
jgi:hypothetical protein